MDPLNQLKDIHLPDPLGIWPPALGWWIVIICGLVLIYYLSRRFILKYKKSLPARQFRKELQQVDTSNSDEQTLRKISYLVKRLAMTRFGRDQVAKLHGENWLKFLDQTMNQPDYFSKGVGQQLNMTSIPDPPLEELTTLKMILFKWSQKIYEDD